MGAFFTCEDNHSQISSQVVLCYPNGEKYLGDYSGGMRNGSGTYLYSNGDRYEGQWLNNMRHGKGTLYDNDGSLYIGEWKNNLKEGEGKFFFLNGSRYIGQWKNNKRNGDGTIISSAGTTFQGSFLNDKKHGKGTHVTKHRKYFEDWKDGVLIERKCENPGPNEGSETDLLTAKLDNFDKSPTNPELSNSMESGSNKIQTAEKLAGELTSKSPSLNGNVSRSDAINSLVVSDKQTDVNVGQDTLSIIDYIDANFPILKKNVFEWDIADVNEWLKHIGLEDYVEMFSINHITGKNLFEIKEDELKDEFKMNSVGHRKNFMNSVDYLRKIYMDNKGRRLSIIRNKLAQLYYKKHPAINWKSKKVKSVCDVIEEEDDNENMENNLLSLPEEHDINEKYKALKMEGFLNSPLATKTKRSSLKSNREGEEEEKKEIPEIFMKTGHDPKSPLAIKTSKSNSTMEKSPSLIKEEAKNEIQNDHNFILKNLKENGIEVGCLIDHNELEILEKIGKGSYGQVFKGRWLGQEVAIKHYDQRASKLKQKRLINFLKEVEIMTYLRHPNIVLFMGVCLNDSKYLMVTEYMAQGSLFDHLHVKHTKFDEEMLLNICEDICLGMCYLHGRKVFHCDLKSSNILLDEAYGVKLCDFGLSRIHSKIDKEGGRIGTPHWMAPEIMRGEKYDEYSDVYSYGMILWEILTKQIPYAGVPILKIINAVGYDEYSIPLPKQGNPLIQEIMRMCLNKSRRARPSFKRILEKLQERKKHKRKYVINQLNGFFGEED